MSKNILANFKVEELKAIEPSKRIDFFYEFVLKEFVSVFGLIEIDSMEKFNKVVSQDKKVRRWYRDLKTEYDKLGLLPEYGLLDGVPDKVKDIVLSESKRLAAFYASHDAKVKNVVSIYKRSVQDLDNEVKNELKTYSKFTLVSTLTIDDVPLADKRKIFIIEDADKVKVFRKDIVSDFKRRCFENLLNNNGEFSKDFGDPFEVK